ncbi:MAG TPA: 3-methyl-2-oxobutanoate hydroxymethyltransferase [Chloroflexota bacterium]|nr:3-methyl-2-oxobutanoate hydroxymethyltransferase [Chloroflexota bacterium]
MGVTAVDLPRMKAGGERITMVTAYDYPTGRLADAAGVDAVLVGDTLGMVVLGHATTIPVTMEAMLHHTAAVTRAVERALVVADMPFLSYQVTVEEAMRNAARLIQQGGAGAVKIEGGSALAPTVARIVGAGIPVMGHVGLTPQSVHQLGGFRLQAKTSASAQRLIEDARALEDAGAFAVVLELVPAPLAQRVTELLSIPTIGIGAGSGCDGQIQVLHDLIGLVGEPETAHLPRHARRYAEIGVAIRQALASYVADVRAGRFPEAANAFEGPPEVRRFVDQDRARGQVVKLPA